ncbi:MAG: PilZ domain-containing protein [bacterium]
MQEKRAFARVPIISSHVDYKVTGMFKKGNMVPLEDISAAGIKVITNEALQLDTLLKLGIQIQNISKQIFAEGRVTWQKKHEKNLFETGIKFTQISEEDKTELMKYIKSEGGRLGEYREFIRCPLEREMKYVFIDNPANEKTCLCNNISRTGLNVILKEKIGEKIPLRLSFYLTEGSTLIKANGEIVWEDEHKEGYIRAGIEFTKISEHDKNKISQYIYSEYLKLR